MVMTAEEGSALAATVEGFEHQWGRNFFVAAPYAYIETLKERMFKPTLSTIIAENTKAALVSSSDPVYMATKKMRDFKVNLVIISTGNKPQGILTSKDVLMRVVAQNLSAELTLMEKGACVRNVLDSLIPTLLADKNRNSFTSSRHFSNDGGENKANQLKLLSRSSSALVN